MDQGGNPGLETQLAAVLDWWRDAGVDAVFHDEPAQWIAPQEASASDGDMRPRADGGAMRSEGGAPSVRGDAPAENAAPPLEPPADLAAFSAWWLAEPALDSGRIAGRVPPRGPAGAALMVLVPEPEQEDDDRLLSGPQGRLLDAMLAAMGIASEDAYVASLLPRHTPHADWEALAALGVGRVAAHHVALVRPRELVLFGQVVPSLLGNDLPNKTAHLPAFNHDGLTVPCLSDRSLGAMLERPRWKAAFWRRWLDRSRG